MNETLAQAAVAAITDDNFVSAPGRCEQFAREVIQSVYGSEYDNMYRSTAQATGQAWADAGFSVQDGPVPGDVVYKISFNPGHVGVVVDGGRVAENSSTQIGRVAGAKGFRSLDQFGAYQLTIRLPDPTHTDPLVLNGQHIADLPLVNGSHLCPIREFAAALGFDLEGNFQDGFTFDGQPVAGTVTLRADHACSQIAALAQAAGLKAQMVDGKVVVSK